MSPPTSKELTLPASHIVKGFKELPAELRLMIWRFAMKPCSTVITSDWWVNYSMGLQGHQADEPYTTSYTQVIAKVNREARHEVLRWNRMRRIVKPGGPVEFINHTSDILAVLEMLLPLVTRTSAWPKPGVASIALPVRRLLSVMETMTQRDYGFMTPGDFSDRSMVDSWLDLMHLPRLRECFMVYNSTSALWDIRGYQVHGPQVISARVNNDPQYQYGDYDITAQEASWYFSDKGIVADTGIPWGDAAWGWYSTHANIGFHGYSSGSRSMGGHWAAFRYHTETKRVEFRPMSWDEVKDVSQSVQSRLAHRRAIPGAVVKIIIVRGQEAPPDDDDNQCWEVLRDEDDDSDDTHDLETVKCLWHCVQDDFNDQSTSAPYPRIHLVP